MFTATAVSDTNGLFNVLGGGAAYYYFPSIPTEVAIIIVCVVELGTVPADTLIRLDFEVLDPSGNVKIIASGDVAVSACNDLTPRVFHAQFLQFELAELGVWTIKAASGQVPLAAYDLEFRHAP